jgi:chromosome segregation ATPase
MKMFLYLAVALVAGFAAGWLTRNLMAGRKEDELHRTLSETKSKLPQFESLMRSRDEQMKVLRQEVKDKDTRIGELHEEIGTQEKTLRESDRELKKVQNRLAALAVDEDATDPGTQLSEVDMTGGKPLDYASVDDASAGGLGGASAIGVGSDDLVNEIKRLEREVERLRQQEQSLESELRSAQAVQSSPASAGSSAMEEVLRSEVHELESRLRQTAAEHDRLVKALDQEKRKVVELERERELQNKSLQVLHQQLELARESGERAANG